MRIYKITYHSADKWLLWRDGVRITFWPTQALAKEAMAREQNREMRHNWVVVAVSRLDAGGFLYNAAQIIDNKIFECAHTPTGNVTAAQKLADRLNKTQSDFEARMAKFRCSSV